MKKIVFVNDMKTKDDVLKIETMLDQLDLEYSIVLTSNSVIILGDNDKLYAAKQAIAQAGFTVL